MGVFNDVLIGEILLFFGEFEERLILLGFEGILGWNWVIFGVVGMAKNLDFSRFCRTRYRSGCWSGFWVKMLGNAYFIRSLWMEQICPFLQSNTCSKM